MRSFILATVIGLVWSGAAQAAEAKKPDSEYCGMGECFPEYITSITRDVQVYSPFAQGWNTTAYLETNVILRAHKAQKISYTKCNVRAPVGISKT